MLYTVNNPLNDLFELTVSYNCGDKADPRLSTAAGFFNEIGTDSLTRQQLGSALQLLGGDVTFSSNNSETIIQVTGVDQNFAATMQLVQHLLLHPKSNDKILKSLKDGVKTEENSLTEENTDVFRAMIQKITLGDNSPKLHRLTYKEAKSLTGEELIEVFNSIYGSACDIVYSGTLDNQEVETIVRKTFPVECSKTAYIDYSVPIIGYDRPIVYVYDMPKSRQTLFFTYDQLKAIPTREARVPIIFLRSILAAECLLYCSRKYVNSGRWPILPKAFCIHSL